MSEVYDFKVEITKKMVSVGDDIYSPNGRKGKIEEITTVKPLSDKRVLIKGKASLT